MNMFHNLRDKFGRFAPKDKGTKKNSKKPQKKRIMHTALVLDESGSMDIVTKSTQDNYNEYIQQLINTNEGLETYVSLVRFVDSSRILVPYENKLLNKDMKIKDYDPSGFTPLYDSIARAIRIIESRFKDGEAVTLTIFTDGGENASTEFARHLDGENRIKEMIINKRDNHNWMINFIGCGDINDVKKQADSIGIFASNTVSYASNTDKNISAVTNTLNSASKSYRASYSSGGNLSNEGFFGN